MIEGYRRRIAAAAYHQRDLFTTWINTQLKEGATALLPTQIQWLHGDPIPKKERKKRTQKGTPLTKEQLDSYYK